MYISIRIKNHQCRLNTIATWRKASMQTQTCRIREIAETVRGIFFCWRNPHKPGALIRCWFHVIADCIHR